MTPRLKELRDQAAAWSQQPTLRAKVSCAGSGCFGCCRGQVTILPEEAQDILPYLTPELEDRIRRARPLNPERALCPLLTGGRCSIYEHRPLVCRVYYSVSPTSWCYPEVVGEGHPVLFLQPPASIAEPLRESKLILIDELKRLLA